MQATQILPVPASPNSLRIMTMLVWFFPLFNKHSFEMYSNTAIKCNPYITSIFYFILYPGVFSLLWKYVERVKTGAGGQRDEKELGRNKSLNYPSLWWRTNDLRCLWWPIIVFWEPMCVITFYCNSLKVKEITYLNKNNNNNNEVQRETLQ